MSDFWSNRRRAVEAEAKAEQEADVEADRAAERAELEALPEAEQLERLGLPNPDSLSLGDDVRAFMSEAVPAALRTRALRRLWRTNPVLANLDGLADYADDFRKVDAARRVTTAYQVGKGLTRHVEKMAQDAEYSGNIETESEVEEETSFDTRQEHSEKNIENSEGCGDLTVDSTPERVEHNSSMPLGTKPNSEGGHPRARMSFSFEVEDGDECDEPGGSGRTP